MPLANNEIFLTNSYKIPYFNESALHSTASRKAIPPCMLSFNKKVEFTFNILQLLLTQFLINRKSGLKGFSGDFLTLFIRLSMVTMTMFLNMLTFVICINYPHFLFGALLMIVFSYINTFITIIV